MVTSPAATCSSPRERGAFATPPRTADLMVDLLEIRPGDRVLDPAAGDGALLAALLRAGVPPSRITAWEVDGATCRALRRRFPGVAVEQRDSLVDTPLDGSGPRFDRVVANPPYLNKASSYVRRHRAALRRRFGPAVGSGETYAMFLYLALRLLAPGGRVSFVVSDTLRTLRTHERLRRYILDHHHVAALAATPRGLFPAAVRAVVVAVGPPRPAAPTRVLPAADDEEAYAGAAWATLPAGTFARIDGHPFVLEAPPSIVALFDHPRRLRDLADGHIGMHTRDNRRRLAALEGSDLARRFAARRRRPGDHPVVSAADVARGGWQPYLKEGGDKDFHHPIVEFLDWRPEARASYVIPRGGAFGRPGFCVSGISRRLSARVMPPGCYWDTNKVMGFVPHEPAAADFLVGLLNTDLYSYLAKGVLNASPSLQLSDLWRLPVAPLPAAVRAEVARIARACVERRAADLRADLRPARRRLNEIVYDAAGITPDDRGAIRRFLRRAGAPVYA